MSYWALKKPGSSAIEVVANAVVLQYKLTSQSIIGFQQRETVLPSPVNVFYALS